MLSELVGFDLEGLRKQVKQAKEGKVYMKVTLLTVLFISDILIGMFL